SLSTRERGIAPRYSGRLRGTAFREARQAVVRDRLPRCGVDHELAIRRPDPGIGVERAEPHAHRARPGIPAPERAAARAAEALCPPLGRLPRGDELVAGDDAQRARCNASLCGSSGAGAALAAGAVAVRGRSKRLVDLVAHAAAEAAAGERQRAQWSSAGSSIPLTSTP